MKTSFFSLLAAASLVATTAFAAPASPAHDRDRRLAQQNPNDRFNDRNNKDFNYGYDKKHQVSPDERKRWEDAHKKDRKDFKNDRKDDRKDYKDDRKDDRKDAKNYGYDKSHKVTPQERARWEAAHKNDNRR